MNQDAQLNDLLKWGIENSTPDANPSDPSATSMRSRAPDPSALAALFGAAPSDAERMQACMNVVQNPEMSAEDKMTAFDNFEQLLEGIDNANNLGPLNLWTPLIDLLDNSPSPDMQRMAAWCVGTAVQNNPAAQTKALELGAIGKLVTIVQREKGAAGNEALRKKAAYALSSEIRNFQPGLDVLLEELGHKSKVEAGDMAAVDELVAGLRAP